MNKELKKIKAFTLVEILVAVGVLGILAAILLPAIVKTTPDSNKVLYRRAYHSLELAINSLANSDEAYPQTKDTTVTIGGYSYQRVFNYTTSTSNGTNSKFCYFLSNTLNSMVGKTCAPRTTAPSTGYFTTPDGIFWNVYSPVADSTNDAITSTTDASTATYQFPVKDNSYTTKVIVDVNGINKGDNCSTDTNAASSSLVTSSGTTALTRCSWYSASTCTKAPDRFIIGVRYDGKLQIGSTDGSDQCALAILSEPINNQKF